MQITDTLVISWVSMNCLAEMLKAVYAPSRPSSRVSSLTTNTIIANKRYEKRASTTSAFSPSPAVDLKYTNVTPNNTFLIKMLRKLKMNYENIIKTDII